MYFLWLFWLYEVFHEKLLRMDFHFLTPLTFLVVHPLGFVCLDTRAPVGREGLALSKSQSPLLNIYFRLNGSYVFTSAMVQIPVPTTAKSRISDE